LKKKKIILISNKELKIKKKKKKIEGKQIFTSSNNLYLKYKSNIA